MRDNRSQETTGMVTPAGPGRMGRHGARMDSLMRMSPEERRAHMDSMMRMSPPGRRATMGQHRRMMTATPGSTESDTGAKSGQER
jgi:hypothetical protein